MAQRPGYKRTDLSSVLLLLGLLRGLAGGLGLLLLLVVRLRRHSSDEWICLL